MGRGASLGHSFQDQPGLLPGGVRRASPRDHRAASQVGYHGLVIIILLSRHVSRRLRKLQEQAADRARAAFLGQDLSGMQNRSYLPHISTAKVLPHNVQQVTAKNKWCTHEDMSKMNPSGDWQAAPGPIGGHFNNNRGGVVKRENFHGGAGSVGVSRNHGFVDGGWAGSAPSMSGQADQLLTLIKNSRNQMGASRSHN